MIKVAGSVEEITRVRKGDRQADGRCQWALGGEERGVFEQGSAKTERAVGNSGGGTVAIESGHRAH